MQLQFSQSQSVLPAHLPAPKASRGQPNGKEDSSSYSKDNSVNAAVTEYTLITLKNGVILDTGGTLSGDDAKLAEDVIFNYMVKSAAWAGADIKTLQDCYLLRVAYPDGTTTDYYAYLHDGLAVMQAGTDGHYSRLDDGLYEKLEALAKSAQASKVSDVDRTDLNACVSDAILSENMSGNQNCDFAAEIPFDTKNSG